MLNWLKKYSKWATYFLVGTALIAVYKTFDSLGSLWTGAIHILSAFKPFILAFVIAYMLNIPVRKLSSLLEKKVKSKFVQEHTSGISIAIVYIIFIVSLVLIIGSIVPAMISNLVEMYSNIPFYAQNIVDFVNNFEPAQKLGFHLETMDLVTQLSSIAEKIFSTDIMDYRDGLRTITDGIWSFASGFMSVFIALIASVYMLLDKDRIINCIKDIANKTAAGKNTSKFLEHCSRTNEIFTQYIYSRLICCLVMAIASTVILALMGEKYALLLGIFIGFMDLIPYFGSIISWVISFFIMAISGGFVHSIWCSIVLLVLQQIDGNILAPKVTGDRLEIRPLAIIIAVSVGGSLFGFAGMLISVPVVAILRAAVSEIIDSIAENNVKG